MVAFSTSACHRLTCFPSNAVQTKESETLLFCGLRVRMCVVTGPQDKVARMALPKPTDQFTSLMKASVESPWYLK